MKDWGASRNEDELMKKKISKYLRYDYPIRIVRYPDGVYCAEIEAIDGLCAYGKTPQEALEQLQEVKEAAFELMLSQGKEPPTPVVHLDIPVTEFEKDKRLKRLKAYVKV